MNYIKNSIILASIRQNAILGLKALSQKSLKKVVFTEEKYFSGTMKRMLSQS
jgi:hypothetical protein